MPGADESEARPQNEALRPLITRVSGAPVAANLIALGLLVLVAVALHTDWLAEAGAILVLSLLLSPVTWVQHVVLMLPALYVLVVTALTRPPGAGLWIATGAYVLMALVLNRELVGRTAYIELLYFGLHTACMLLVLGMVVWWRPASTDARDS